MQGWREEGCRDGGKDAGMGVKDAEMEGGKDAGMGGKDTGMRGKDAGMAQLQGNKLEAGQEFLRQPSNRVMSGKTEPGSA